MLDTNICIYIIKRKPEKVLRKFEFCNYGDICISSITLGELEFGVCKSQSPERNGLALKIFLEGIVVAPFDIKAAMEYGDIRANLERKGTPIGANDMLIAAHARSLKLILVTNNLKEFSRVENLVLENWT